MSGIRPVRAVLFDLDETLLDRRASLHDFVTWQASRMLRPDVVDVTRFVELDRCGRVWKDEVYAVLREEFALAGWSVEELLSGYELCFRAFCRARDGAAHAVGTLHERGFALGLVSNGRTPFQERNFRALGFGRMFGTVVVSAAVGRRKPDAAIFHTACARLGVAPGETVFVGDDPVADVQGAHDAGLRAIHAPRDPDAPVCAAADVRIDALMDLPDVVGAMHASAR